MNILKGFESLIQRQSEIDKEVKELRKDEKVQKYLELQTERENIRSVQSDLYKAFKEIIDYKDKKMKDLHVLDSNEEYPNIMGLCAKYNSIKLFKQLEEHLKI
jgi:hypothetical protein